MKHLILSLILSAAMIGGYAQDKPKSTQCTELTTNNVRCKRAAEPGKQACKQHDKDLPRCGVITSKGQPCKRPVKAQGLHCWQHQFS